MVEKVGGHHSFENGADPTLNLETWAHPRDMCSRLSLPTICQHALHSGNVFQLSMGRPTQRAEKCRTEPSTPVTVSPHPHRSNPGRRYTPLHLLDKATSHQPRWATTGISPADNHWRPIWPAYKPPDPDQQGRRSLVTFATARPPRVPDYFFSIVSLPFYDRQTDEWQPPSVLRHHKSLLILRVHTKKKSDQHQKKSNIGGGGEEWRQEVL